VHTNAVPDFLPSRHGFRFPNRWPAAPARTWSLGLLQIGIGDSARGLCGGMAFTARDRWENREAGATEAHATEAEPPAPGTPLFREIVDRQFASFGRLFNVPLRFWLAAALGTERSRLRGTVREAWPEIRRRIDAGEPPMVGLVRQAGLNPLNSGLGHQVVAYRYDARPERVAIGVYDPNHPGEDTVEVRITRSPEGRITLEQSTGEPLIALLSLPFKPARSGPQRGDGSP
jgi:hypothetical protein